MSFSIEFADDQGAYDARIKVIGVGGSGGNAVNTMINFGLEGVEFIVVNTDAQALNASLAPNKFHIGSSVTRGLGAGADPEKGKKAALEDVTRLKELLSGADMVFVTAGMGGGTGTGAAPVIAQLAREEGCLTVGVVTKPFLFEGKQRSRRAETGLAMLTEHVDTLVTIPNQKLLALGDEELSFVDAFRKADEVLYQAIKGISDLITQSGLVNVDFADVKTVMANMGRALMGTGCAKGQGRARLAAETAVNSPLLDNLSVEGSMGVLINIVGGPDMKMKEIEEAASYIQEQAHEDANIIFGAAVDENMGDMMKVTVIATGFDRPADDYGTATAVRTAPNHAAGWNNHQQQQAPMQQQHYSIPSQPQQQQQHHHAQTPQSAQWSNKEAPIDPRSARQPNGMRPTMSSPRLDTRDQASSRPGAPSRGPGMVDESTYDEMPHSRGDERELNIPTRRAPVREAERGTNPRDRASFVPPLDSDWDTPAFQRRNSS